MQVNAEPVKVKLASPIRALAPVTVAIVLLVDPDKETAPEPPVASSHAQAAPAPPEVKTYHLYHNWHLQFLFHYPL